MGSAGWRAGWIKRKQRIKVKATPSKFLMIEVGYPLSEVF